MADFRTNKQQDISRQSEFVSAQADLSKAQAISNIGSVATNVAGQYAEEVQNEEAREIVNNAFKNITGDNPTFQDEPLDDISKEDAIVLDEKTKEIQKIGNAKKNGKQHLDIKAKNIFVELQKTHPHLKDKLASVVQKEIGFNPIAYNVQQSLKRDEEALMQQQQELVIAEEASRVGMTPEEYKNLKIKTKANNTVYESKMAAFRLSGGALSDIRETATTKSFEDIRLLNVDLLDKANDPEFKGFNKEAEIQNLTIMKNQALQSIKVAHDKSKSGQYGEEYKKDTLEKVEKNWNGLINTVKEGFTEEKLSKSRSDSIIALSLNKEINTNSYIRTLKVLGPQVTESLLKLQIEWAGNTDVFRKKYGGLGGMGQSIVDLIDNGIPLKVKTSGKTDKELKSESEAVQLMWDAYQNSIDIASGENTLGQPHVTQDGDEIFIDEKIITNNVGEIAVKSRDKAIVKNSLKTLEKVKNKLALGSTYIEGGETLRLLSKEDPVMHKLAIEKHRSIYSGATMVVAELMEKDSELDIYFVPETGKYILAKPRKNVGRIPSPRELESIGFAKEQMRILDGTTLTGEKNGIKVLPSNQIEFFELEIGDAFSNHPAMDKFTQAINWAETGGWSEDIGSTSKELIKKTLNYSKEFKLTKSLKKLEEEKEAKRKKDARLKESRQLSIDNNIINTGEADAFNIVAQDEYLKKKAVAELSDYDFKELFGREKTEEEKVIPESPIKVFPYIDPQIEINKLKDIAKRIEDKEIAAELGSILKNMKLDVVGKTPKTSTILGNDLGDANQTKITEGEITQGGINNEDNIKDNNNNNAGKVSITNGGITEFIGVENNAMELFKADKVIGEINEDGESNLVKFSEMVNKIESDGKGNAKASTSSAKGNYQFTDDSFKTAQTRLKNVVRKGIIKEDGEIKTILNSDGITDLTPDQQQLLFFVNLQQRKNTSGLLKRIVEGDELAEIELYYKDHHTNPDEATRNRVRGFYNSELEEEAYKNYKK